jgi:hypothetical protein
MYPYLFFFVFEDKINKVERFSIWNHVPLDFIPSNTHFFSNSIFLQNKKYENNIFTKKNTIKMVV